MKAPASWLRQPSPPANKPTAGPGDSAAAAPPKSRWRRFTARVRSWFEIPYGYQDEKGFHYGLQTPPVFTDRASEAMTYPLALPKSTSAIPDQAPAPAVPVAK